MIPHVIHYFWFGGTPLSKTAEQCIASWRKYLPDYEIKEWNESNFDVNIIPFTAEAYKFKKYAFASKVWRSIYGSKCSAIIMQTKQYNIF